MDKIVVMGGSFNPPTLAHLKIMEAAIQQLDAGMGYFVPVSQAHLKRKIRHTSGFCIDASLRVQMLQTMCHNKIDINTTQLNNVVFHTNQMMSDIQQLYPSALIYFLAGADKLDLIADWCKKYNFLDQYYLGLFSRNGIDINHPLLDQYQERITYLSLPHHIENISSTLVRECLLENRICDSQPYLTQDVYDIYKTLTMDNFPLEIDSFKDDYAFLDNSYPCHFIWHNLSWSCAEAAILAARFNDYETLSKMNSQQARKYANNKIERNDWKEIRLDVVKDILYAKFTQNDDLKDQLINTQNCLLIYGHHKKDYYWGKNLYNDKGENHLGTILMKIREVLK